VRLHRSQRVHAAIQGDRGSDADRVSRVAALSSPCNKAFKLISGVDKSELSDQAPGVKNYPPCRRFIRSCRPVMNTLGFAQRHACRGSRHCFSWSFCARSAFCCNVARQAMRHTAPVEIFNRATFDTGARGISHGAAWISCRRVARPSVSEKCSLKAQR
jgi:hypothetical protein